MLGRGDSQRQLCQPDTHVVHGSQLPPCIASLGERTRQTLVATVVYIGVVVLVMVLVAVSVQGRCLLLIFAEQCSPYPRLRRDVQDH
jgi:hypothetical protein